MASVYLAIQDTGVGTQRLAVLKVVRDVLAGQSEYREMFAQEAALAVRLAHPNVVHSYEVSHEGGVPFLAMEYLDGQSLLSTLRRVGRRTFPLDLHVFVLVEVLRGLQYAHGLRDYDGAPLCLVHRDVTPGNVFLTYEGAVKLFDFGIAKTALAHTKTDVGVLKGKVSYMAPEQASMGPIGPSTDVFAVGVMLWEALAGTTLARKHDDPNAILIRRLGTGDPSALEAAPEADLTLAAICDRAMARSVTDRYASALEMQEDLEAWLLDRSLGSSALQRELSRLLLGAFESERAGLARRIDEAMSRPADTAASIVELRRAPESPSVETSAPTLARTIDPSEAPGPLRRGRFPWVWFIATTLAVLAIGASASWVLRRPASPAGASPEAPSMPTPESPPPPPVTPPPAPAAPPSAPPPASATRQHRPRVTPAAAPVPPPSAKPRAPKPIDKEDPY